MNREFLELYERELSLLEESAAEFAEDYPGVADRLGGLTRDAMDPMIKGLLEGSAFLAARVQLKIKHEFPEFTNNLLEQLLPNYLAPTPSAMMAAVTPPYDNPALADGMRIQAGDSLDARFVERDTRISCRYKLAGPITLWPIDVANAEFLPQRSAIAALGIEDEQAIAGLVVTLRRRTAVSLEDEPQNGEQLKPEQLLSSCRTDELAFRLSAELSDSIRLYEKLFANCVSIWVRYLDGFGNPVLRKLPLDCVKQIGMEHEEPLWPSSNAVFRGFDLLRELFVLPEKFLGFRLTGLKSILPALAVRQADFIFTFNRSDARLPSVVRAPVFRLYAAPAINLFEMQTSRVSVSDGLHEYHVIPDRGQYLNFEPHRVVNVTAHFLGSSEKQEAYPLYSAPADNVSESDSIFYTLRRVMRKRTGEEKRSGRTSSYIGTDLYMLLVPGEKALRGRKISELSVRAVCSNRHLTEHLPVGVGGTDFILDSNTKLDVHCIAGPTAPRESIIGRVASAATPRASGSTAWRLINLLAFNHLGLTGRGTPNSANAMREVMALFANTDAATEKQVAGLTKVESRPVVRRIRQPDGAGVARGLEITLTFDDKAYEGSGLFLFGAVLDRFLAEYAPINSFTQTVVRSIERGEVMRWPPRIGVRTTL
jgi:type VI secretion system protein ImpG